mmetsp:Transcript_46297/g.116587  ORF Transcript_46297/g.116587 Transcript_46297/m.116587 type:complete len:219 (+) Transcript_46297:114-770(+)
MDAKATSRSPSSDSSSGLSTRFLRCTIKISRRLAMSGLSIEICRSKRPGRSRAGSRMSGRLVPASTTTPLPVSKPSISTRSWLRVFSRSSLPPFMEPLPRLRPTASISSKNTMQGAFLRASLKRSRTRAGPTPAYISIKSEPDVEKNGTLASPAVARANKVLPVPGGPTNRAPRGMRAPSLRKWAGFCRNSTNSITSCLASGRPATSLNETPIAFSGL